MRRPIARVTARGGGHKQPVGKSQRSSARDRRLKRRGALDNGRAEEPGQRQLTWPRCSRTGEASTLFAHMSPRMFRSILPEAWAWSVLWVRRCIEPSSPLVLRLGSPIGTVNRSWPWGNQILRVCDGQVGSGCETNPHRRTTDNRGKCTTGVLRVRSEVKQA